MENHLQFDTLRRAKHSTSLVLHMLHNPQHAVVPERLVVEAQAARARAETLPIPEGGAAAPPPVPQPRAFDVITAHAPELTYSAGAMAQAIALSRSVPYQPPCTVPIGLVWSNCGTPRKVTRPGSTVSTA